ncbi:hypothetical protein M2254_000775 [Chryseobacterium sp. BIGb0186]|nr:hypothetical protein [Chryseobacterium sp. JUb44]MDH6209191.1 hypothetical protein [Chryseobacterium sp. BIGb0186]
MGAYFFYNNILFLKLVDTKKFNIIKIINRIFKKKQLILSNYLIF